MLFLMWIDGAGRGTRTPNLRFTKPLHYQLCYVGFFLIMCQSKTNTSGFLPRLYGTPLLISLSISFLYIICASQPSAPHPFSNLAARHFKRTYTFGPANDLTRTTSPALYFMLCGAGDEIRTHDIHVGNVGLYR